MKRLRRHRKVRALDSELPDEVAKTLIAFCIHEHLHYPMTKKMFLQQPVPTQQKHLRYMRQVTGNPLFDNEAYRDFLAKQKEKPKIIV